MENDLLTVEIKADGCIAFTQFIFRSHFVFASILNCDIIYLKWCKIWLTFLLINRLLLLFFVKKNQIGNLLWAFF